MMIDQLLTGFVIGLATWRLSYALTEESIFGWLRDLFNVEMVPTKILRFGVETVEHRNESTNVIGKLLSCLYCTSFWVGTVFYGVWHVHIYGEYIVWIFAIGAIAVLIQDWRVR